MKKTIILILIAFCFITIIYTKNSSDVDIDVTNNIDKSLINWDDYNVLNNDVYISYNSNKVSGLLLKVNSGFGIEFTGNVLKIEYDEKDHDKDDHEVRLHYVKIIKGDVKSIFINGKDVFSK
ncbi:MAG: hypothetical protein VB048_09585 [Bacteroidaceae bacterium]|nr:hypothetical protein [Bacteroidaceae bacterium]